jgi:hypothetical protein
VLFIRLSRCQADLLKGDEIPYDVRLKILRYWIGATVHTTLPYDEEKGFLFHF